MSFTVLAYACGGSYNVRLLRMRMTFFEVEATLWIRN